jgi:hypothetical protein
MTDEEMKDSAARADRWTGCECCAALRLEVKRLEDNEDVLADIQTAQDNEMNTIRAERDAANYSLRMTIRNDNAIILRLEYELTALRQENGRLKEAVEWACTCPPNNIPWEEYAAALRRRSLPDDRR